MTEVFKIKERHNNLRSDASNFKRENVKSTHYGIQSNMEYSTMREYKKPRFSDFQESLYFNL